MVLLMLAAPLAASFTMNVRPLRLNKEGEDMHRSRPIGLMQAPKIHRLCTRSQPIVMQAPKIRPPPKDDGEASMSNPNEDSVDFEFDATTVVALLGAAIAFNFFVVANL